MFTDASTGIGGTTGDLYIRINATSTVQVNASEKNPPDPPAPATYQTASTDGSRVFFTTSEQLTDTPLDGAAALYMYDLNAPAGHRLTLITVDHEPADPPNSVQGVLGASNDGHYVYFICAGQLVAGQPPLLDHLGVYEWHDGTTSYIGELANLNATDDETKDVLPNQYGFGQIEAQVSSNGRFAVFQSSTGAGLTGYDSNTHVELYVYDGDTHQLHCASCRPDGTPAAGNAFNSARAFKGASSSTSHVSPAVTNDGKVFFTSTDALVPQDTNGRADAYEFDSATGTVHLLSTGTDTGDSYFMDATPNGNDVLFATRQPLVGWDTDQSYDLYDARVNGGFPEPVSSLACSGEPCQGELAGAPAGSSSATGSFSGAGNLAPPPAPPVHTITNAQRLRSALAQCRRRYAHSHKRRGSCEHAARHRYATSAKRSSHRRAR
jgi:hypothetical protein